MTSPSNSDDLNVPSIVRGPWNLRAIFSIVLIFCVMGVALSFFFREEDPLLVRAPAVGRVPKEDNSPQPAPRQSTVPARSPITLLSEDINQGATCKFFSPNGHHLVTGIARKGKVFLSIWDVAKKQEMRALEMPRSVSSISMSGSGDMLAVAVGGPSVYSANQLKDDGKPREVRLFSFPDLEFVAKVENELFVGSAVLSPDGRLLAMLRNGNNSPEWELVLWDIVAEKPKHVFHDIYFPHSVPVVHFSPDGKRLAHITRARMGGNPIWIIREFEIDSGMPLDVLSEHPSFRSGFEDFEYLPDGKGILLKDRRWLLSYEVAQKNYRIVYSQNRPSVNTREWFDIRCAVVSVDGEWLVIVLDEYGLRDGTPLPPRIVIWDLQAGKIDQQWTIPNIGNYISSLALSPDKKTIAVGATGLYLYDVPVK